MTIDTLLDNQLLQQIVNLVWDKLSKVPENMGDNVHYWEWTPGVGMYDLIKAHEGTKQPRYESFIKQWALDNASKIKFDSVPWLSSLAHTSQCAIEQLSAER